MNDVLRNLIDKYGVSGHECDVKKYIIDEIKSVKSDADLKEDKAGNLILKVGKKGKKLMLTSHVDEVGFMTEYIEDNGLIRAEKIGNFNGAAFVNSTVEFENGVLAKIIKWEESNGTFMIDTGIEKDNMNIRLGDTARPISHLIETNKNLFSSSLESRACAFALLNAAKKAVKSEKKINNEIYFVFSVQGEIGARGVRTAAFEIRPDMCIVLDTLAEDRAKKDMECGKGPASVIVDRGLMASRDVISLIHKIGDKANVNVQDVISPESLGGGTLHKEAGGIKTAVLGLPLRYKNTPSEMIDIKDLNGIEEILDKVIYMEGNLDEDK